MSSPGREWKIRSSGRYRRRSGGIRRGAGGRGRCGRRGRDRGRGRGRDVLRAGLGRQESVGSAGFLLPLLDQLLLEEGFQGLALGLGADIARILRPPGRPRGLGPERRSAWPPALLDRDFLRGYGRGCRSRLGLRLRRHRGLLGGRLLRRRLLGGRLRDGPGFRGGAGLLRLGLLHGHRSDPAPKIYSLKSDRHASTGPCVKSYQIPRLMEGEHRGNDGKTQRLRRIRGICPIRKISRRGIRSRFHKYIN